MVGNSGVGKTNILSRLTENKFINSKSTIGVEFKTKSISCKGKVVKAQIWDTGKEKKTKNITKDPFHLPKNYKIIAKYKKFPLS